MDASERFTCKVINALETFFKCCLSIFLFYFATVIIYVIRLVLKWIAFINWEVVRVTSFLKILPWYFAHTLWPTFIGNYPPEDIASPSWFFIFLEGSNSKMYLKDSLVSMKHCDNVIRHIWSHSSRGSSFGGGEGTALKHKTFLHWASPKAILIINQILVGKINM